MTTAATRSPAPVVPGARAGLLVTVALATLAGVTGSLVDGRPAFLGVLVGAAMVGFFFAFGAVTTAVAAAYAPAVSLLVALLTYTLQVLVLGLVFWGLTRSGATEEAVSPQWIGGTVIAGTVCWVVVLVVSGVRRRLPAYDVALPTDGTPGEVER